MSDDLAKEAVARHALHMDHPTCRPLSRNYELIGLRGEEAMSETFGVQMDMTRRPGGDGGKDCLLKLWVGDELQTFVVDVKAARKPGNLIVEVGKVVPRTIYILGRYYDQYDHVELLGWEWGANVLRAPTRDFGYGVINHYLAAARLRKIAELMARQHKG